MVDELEEPRPIGGAVPDRPPKAPRWVKIFALIAAAVVIVFVVLLLVRGPGGAGHGPALHGYGDSRTTTVVFELG